MITSFYPYQRTVYHESYPPLPYFVQNEDGTFSRHYGRKPLERRSRESFTLDAQIKAGSKLTPSPDFSRDDLEVAKQNITRLESYLDSFQKTNINLNSSES